MNIKDIQRIQTVNDMIIRLIISFLFLAVTSCEIVAKNITLNKLDISKNHSLENVIKMVSTEGDTIVSGKKFFIVSLQEYRKGLYLSIELIEGKSLPNVSDYIGFLCVNNNLFFIRSSTNIDSIIKTDYKKQFAINLSPPKIDGLIIWNYFIIDNKIYQLEFKSNW